MKTIQHGDNAIRRADSLRGKRHEMTYDGALSFLRRKYTRDLAGGEVVVSGVPYDAAVTFRPGCPVAVRCPLRHLGI